MRPPRKNAEVVNAIQKLPSLQLSKIALLLDVDGTLLDLAALPDEVSVPWDLREALQALSNCGRCALALVSGRPAAQIDALFAPLKFAVIGCHGAEIRRGPQAQLQKRIPLEDGIRRPLYDLAARFSGTLLEDKGFSIAVHYRATPALEKPLRQAAHEFVAAHPTIELLAGKFVIEFKSRGYSKATACTELLKYPPFHGRTPVFLGDDVTDESVFRILSDFDGIGISVGRPMDGAQYMLQSPASVRSWLKDIAPESDR